MFSESEEIKVDVDQGATKRIGELGLNWEDLKGKKILDVGAGFGMVAQAAKTRGIDIVSIERYPEKYPQKREIVKGTHYLKGDARKMPFGDDSFDLIISNNAPPSNLADQKDYIKVMKEFERILKPGGEARFSAYIGFRLDEKEQCPPEKFDFDEDFLDSQRIRQIRILENQESYYLFEKK